MPPSALIIEFNRCFEPNPWNTGPRIPSFQQPTADKTSATLTQDNEAASDPFATLRREVNTPDLTNSPASSVSSGLSLYLEDEEIRKIFSNAKYDHHAGNSPQDLLDVFASQSDMIDWNIPVAYPARKEELNPHAAPFVPSFAFPSNLHHPFNTISMDHFQPSPLNLDFSPLDFVDTSIFPDQSPLPHDSPHLHSVPLPPLFPPGLPHPPIPSIAEPELATAVAEPACPPRYLPVLIEALKPSTSARGRGVLAHVIVTTFPAWDMENLLELAELLCEAASKPPADVREGEWFACESSRYIPAQNELRFRNHGADETKPENIVAMLAEELHTHLSQLHGDMGQIFAWNLRETALMRFIHCWDCAKPTSITYETNPPPQYVWSGLTLCKLIPALFKRKLITREHISMCISVLFKDLMSVEHVEALANIVLGCGPAFWGLLNSDSATEAETASVIPDDTLLLAKIQQSKSRLNDHVNNFLVGLELNLFNRGLADNKSVLGQPWGEGQLLAVIKDIVDSVKLWEAVLTTTPTKVGVDATDLIIYTSAMPN